MKVEIRCFGSYHWSWTLKDSFGHPVCTCSPRTKARFYYSKATCIHSVERFEQTVLGDNDHFEVVVYNQKTGEWDFLW